MDIHVWPTYLLKICPNFYPEKNMAPTDPTYLWFGICPKFRSFFFLRPSSVSLTTTSTVEDEKQEGEEEEGQENNKREKKNKGGGQQNQGGGKKNKGNQNQKGGGNPAQKTSPKTMANSFMEFEWVYMIIPEKRIFN